MSESKASKTYKQRPIFATAEKGKLQIKYQAHVAPEIKVAHKIYGFCCPCTCMCHEPLSKELRESTYVQVLENRIEYNYPHSIVTCGFPDIWRVNCHVVDNVSVIYFDRAIIKNAAKAQACSPMCTHNRCCPTCMDMCGEAVVLYEDSPGCGAGCKCCHVSNVGVSVPNIVPRHCCGAQNVLLPCLEDAEALARIINETRDARLEAQKIEVEADMSR